jgi:hypothetical protein
MTKYFWLSFCDNEKPKGAQFLGACIVGVSDAEAAAMLDEIDVRFPDHADGAEWIGAASRKAWSLGCNPGGEMACGELPLDEPLPEAVRRRLGRLMTRDECAAFDAEMQKGTVQ